MGLEPIAIGKTDLQDFTMEKGFSLLELVFAVCLLGLLFLFTLRGAEAVQAMRAFMTAYEIQKFQAQFQLYGALYSYYPGDDPRAPERFGRPPSGYILNGSFVTGSGNSKLEGKLSDVLSPNNETFAAWRDLRAAGLVSGDVELAGAAAMPSNYFGGVYGFDEGNLGQKNGSLCATRIPGLAAQRIDAQIDDGAVASGRVVATSRFSIESNNHFDAPDEQPYDPEKTYILCAPLLP